MGDLGFVWAGYKVSVDGAVKKSGRDVFTPLLGADGKWLVSGLQTA